MKPASPPKLQLGSGRMLGCRPPGATSRPPMCACGCPVLLLLHTIVTSCYSATKVNFKKVRNLSLGVLLPTTHTFPVHLGDPAPRHPAQPPGWKKMCVPPGSDVVRVDPGVGEQLICAGEDVERKYRVGRYLIHQLTGS